MKRCYAFAMLFTCCLAFAGFSREVKLVRYPDYHQGRIVFTYLGDIWTADENGQNIHRVTVHRARDLYPRFSPDGRWILIFVRPQRQSGRLHRAGRRWGG